MFMKLEDIWRKFECYFDAEEDPSIKPGEKKLSDFLLSKNLKN